MSNAVRMVLVALLLVGGVVRLSTASTPARAATVDTAPSSGVCQLGHSCS